MFRRVSSRFRRRPRENDRLSPGEHDGLDQPYLETDDAMAANGADEPILDSVPRPRTRVVVRVRLLVLVALLVAALAVMALNITLPLPTELLARWPWLLMIGGVLWLLVGLVTAWPHGTLGGPVVIALGALGLLEQGVMSSGSMVVAGMTLIALGLAVILRGLTMPRV